jgi:hypothetical protein
MGERYLKGHLLGMAAINRMVNYAKVNRVSLIGIINYEVSKLRHQKIFFIAMENGVASDGYRDYVENTKKYLDSQGVKYTTKIVGPEVHNNRTGTVTIEQGTEFIIK